MMEHAMKKKKHPDIDACPGRGREALHAYRHRRQRKAPFQRHARRAQDNATRGEQLLGDAVFGADGKMRDFFLLVKAVYSNAFAGTRIKKGKTVVRKGPLWPLFDESSHGRCLCGRADFRPLCLAEHGGFQRGSPFLSFRPSFRFPLLRLLLLRQQQRESFSMR